MSQDNTATCVTDPSAEAIQARIYTAFTALNRNMIVGISGRGGAGKSTLTDQISEGLTQSGCRVYAFHVDDFVFPKAIRDANPDPGKARYEDSYDFKTLYLNLLRPLKEQTDFQGEVTVLNRQQDRQEPRAVSVEGPAVILVEGVQLFRKQFAEIIDFKIWLDIPFEEGLRRAMARKNHLGVSMTEDQKREQYVKWSTAGYAFYEQNDQPKEQADIVISFPELKTLPSPEAKVEKPSLK